MVAITLLRLSAIGGRDVTILTRRTTTRTIWWATIWLSSGNQLIKRGRGTYVDANSVGHGFLRPGAPGVGSFTPSSGPAGTTVTINGRASAERRAWRSTAAAANFTVDSDTQITATVPGGATTGSLSVNNAFGDRLEFQRDAVTVDSAGVPTISSFSPASGSAGWTVTLTGTNFTGTTGVSFNGTPATTMWAISDTQFNAKVPSGRDQWADHADQLFGLGGIGRELHRDAAHQFVHAGDRGGGLDGDDHRHKLHRSYCSDLFPSAASFTVNSDTQITATVPGGALNGWISVKTPNGTTWSSSNFTPTSPGPPTISSFSPASGRRADGDADGNKLHGDKSGEHQRNGSDDVLATSDTQLNVKIPSGATSDRFSHEHSRHHHQRDHLIVN